MTSVQERVQTQPEADVGRSGPLPRGATSTTAVTSAHLVAWSLSVVSGLCIAFLVFVLVLSPLQQNRTQDLLYGEFRAQLAAASAPFGVTPIEPGAPVAILDIADLALRQTVVEGTGSSDLRSGPGHERDTVLPGQVGTSVLFGRSTTYGAPFGDVASLQPGARLRVVTGQGVFRYRVEDVRHNGDLAPPALEFNQSRLILVTADGSLLRPGSTVYVDALLIGDPTVTPPRPTVVVAPFEAPMASDYSALLPLVLWLLALLAAGVFVVWGVLRWGGPQTWMVAVPVVLAAIWGSCDSAALLLPNLM